MNSALFVVVLITGLALVGAALLIAGLISPRSFNPQKGEAYVVSHRAANLGCSSK